MMVCCAVLQDPLIVLIVIRISLSWSTCVNFEKLVRMQPLTFSAAAQRRVDDAKVRDKTEVRTGDSIFCRRPMKYLYVGMLICSSHITRSKMYSRVI